MRRLFPSIVVMLVSTISTGEASQPQVLICNRLYAIDGDSISCNDINMRDMGEGEPFVSGYDTPEIEHRKCEQELVLGRLAKKRMNELLETPGIKIFDSGEVDKTQSKRPLVSVKLPNGVTAGHILIAEGLARRWTPEYNADWCS